jgi:hypothetical protein
MARVENDCPFAWALECIEQLVDVHDGVLGRTLRAAAAKSSITSFDST